MTLDPTDNAAVTGLCLRLTRADTEADVVGALVDAGYWDDPIAWRLFSDNDNAFAVIGNQQAEAVAAFVEKIVNSSTLGSSTRADSQGVTLKGRALRDRCVMRWPASSKAAITRSPRTGGSLSGPMTRRLWRGAYSPSRRRGHMPPGQPSLTVADKGEGQTPDCFPDTFMSIQRNNKLRIPFVQGKFNMCGTGAFQFSKLQLVVSRRDPAFLNGSASARDVQWGFTIVRREPPTEGAKSSVFRYLAPVPISGSDLRGVLAFAADELPIFPEADATVRDAYCRPAPYDHSSSSTSTRGRAPSRTSSCRATAYCDESMSGCRNSPYLCAFRVPARLLGHLGSFATNALGLVARLDRDRDKNLEAGGRSAA